MSPSPPQLMQVLSAKEYEAALRTLNGWHKMAKREAIEKQFIFADFATAFAWMSHIAIIADKLDHHPEWSNVYNRVDVVLTTHDAKGITARDITLAHLMNEHAPR